MKKVVIADHHPIVRKGISCILKNDVNLSIVGIVDNGSDLLILEVSFSVLTVHCFAILLMQHPAIFV